MNEIRMFSTPSLSRWLDRLMSMTLYVYILLTHMLLPIVYESLLYGEQADDISPLNIQVEDLPREEELTLADHPDLALGGTRPHSSSRWRGRRRKKK